jgi:glycosyltransferase involved in cell wall biosynthesis
MSYGLCVLSSDIPENLELTEELGLTFKVDDVQDLSLQLKDLLSRPATEIHDMGQRARLHIAKHYDWKDIAETTEYLYELLWLEPELTQQQA